ncbi:uncharacterized protein LOC117605611 isoform X2 [Osmia lignaria lignaria]|uniref:uncharacterized protein LOC117605611 isoform X1 n=1 Tax=Osmia lignaria lignaria TaxID=1437193 RepID=UPI001478ECD3|nr:uncharacterized protein LOC117605611 isoform X1 [Osmia lignaria]XP_034183153.1 uncharacterized protein LOC117605611 isoform X2 [Osmia lignaria]
MKLFLILGLLCVGIHGEKKINLEDIERDNLRAEDVSQPGNTRSEEPKYSPKPEIGQQQYQIQNQYNGPPNSQVAYVTPSSVPSETYVRAGSYATKEQAYQQQNNILQEQIQSPRYYNEYQQQSFAAKGIAPNIYETQQLVYQPEVNVGNQLQSTQQKTITAKYSKNVNKDTVYIDIPVMHLLAYYPNLDVHNGKNNGFLVPQFNTREHISIPVYTSALSQKPIVPAKPSYQVQYASKYNSVAPSAFTTKITKGTAYTTPVTSKKFTNSPLTNVPTYLSPDQSYAQGRQFLYTQAYIAPSQSQYVPQFVYSQPTTVYMHATPVYSDIYARTPTYVQDNALQAGSKYKPSSDQLDTGVPVADELAGQVLVQQTSQSVSQNYVKDLGEPSTDLVPPQAAAQNFQSAPLLPVSSQEEESVPDQNHVGLSEPRSLLDSYVPSKLIAAQDSARYQERPIKLEGGFLPSKENFLYKKRKTD